MKYWARGGSKTSLVQTIGAMAVGYRVSQANYGFKNDLIIRLQAFKLQEYADFHENIIFPASFDVSFEA